MPVADSLFLRQMQVRDSRMARQEALQAQEQANMQRMRETEGAHLKDMAQAYATNLDSQLKIAALEGQTLATQGEKTPETRGETYQDPRLEDTLKRAYEAIRAQKKASSEAAAAKLAEKKDVIDYTEKVAEPRRTKEFDWKKQNSIDTRKQAAELARLAREHAERMAKIREGGANARAALKEKQKADKEGAPIKHVMKYLESQTTGLAQFGNREQFDAAVAARVRLAHLTAQKLPQDQLMATFFMTPEWRAIAELADPTAINELTAATSAWGAAPTGTAQPLPSTVPPKKAPSALNPRGERFKKFLAGEGIQ